MAQEKTASGQALTVKEQKILDDGYRLFNLFQSRNLGYKAEVALSRKIAMMKDPGQDPEGTPVGEKSPQLHTLRSTMVSCVADQCDNMPEAVIMPETPDTQELAEALTDIVGYVYEVNKRELTHRERVEDCFSTGTACKQTVWDSDARGGRGEIATFVVPIENIEWDSQAAELQQSRAIFKKEWHPKQYYEEHYPDYAEFIMEDEYVPADGTQGDDEDPSVMLLEYWYRRYNAKRKQYEIHVAYLAGHALLYYSEKAHPKGIYDHGEYPFKFDIFTRVPGKPYGRGMMMEFCEMQRAINRYAKYIDENSRAAAKMRLLVAESSGISEEDLRDWNKQIIKGDVINENAVRWFQSSPLSPQVNNQMNGFIDMIKLDSGQNQFNRGEGGLGVTAGNAIQALQEAGGKTTRFRTSVFKFGTEDEVRQILWLVRQFYTEDRTLMIVGRDGILKQVPAKASRYFNSKDAMPYSVRIQIQRSNPLVVQQENDTIMQLANVMAQGQQPIEPMTLVRLLQLGGKDRLMAALREQEVNQVTQLKQVIGQQQMEADQMAGDAAERIQEMQTMMQKQAGELAGMSSDVNY